MFIITQRMLDGYYKVLLDPRGLSPRNEEYNKFKYGINSRQFMRVDSVIKKNPTLTIKSLKLINEILVQEAFEF